MYPPSSPERLGPRAGVGQEVKKKAEREDPAWDRPEWAVQGAEGNTHNQEDQHNKPRERHNSK